MSPAYSKNVFIHDCMECEESHIETCDACLSNPNPIKDPHACRCAIITVCKECCVLSGKINNMRENIAKLESLRAPALSIQMAHADLANMLEAINCQYISDDMH